MKSPFNYTRSLGINDERLSLIQATELLDVRINFVCLDYPNFIEHMDEFDGSSEEALEQALEQYVSEIVNAKMEIDSDEGTISLPRILETYKPDFGGTNESLLTFVFKYYESEIELDTVLQMVENNKLIINYED